jgi:hypothetical protein
MNSAVARGISPERLGRFINKIPNWDLRPIAQHMGMLVPKTASEKRAFLEPLVKYWHTLPTHHKWMTGIGGGMALLALIHRLSKGGMWGPLLGLGGLGLAGYGLSGGLHNLLKHFRKEPAAAPAVPAAAIAAPAATPNTPQVGLTLAEAAKHPMVQKYVNPDGTIRYADAIKAPDEEIRQGLGLLNPEAQGQLRDKLTSFKPSWAQSLGARAMGIDIEGQRNRVLGLFPQQQAASEKQAWSWSEPTPQEKLQKFQDEVRHATNANLLAGLGTVGANLAYLAPYGLGDPMSMLSGKYLARAGKEYDPATFDEIVGHSNLKPSEVVHVADPFSPHVAAAIPGTRAGGLKTVDDALKALSPEKPKAHTLVISEPTIAQGTMAHELGHSRLQSKLYSKSRLLGKMNAFHPAVGQVGMLGGSIGGSFGHMPTAIAGTAITLPQLLNEILASHIGGRTMLRTHRPKGFGGKLKNYLSAYRGVPTYAIGASMPMGSYGIRKYLDQRREKKGAEFRGLNPQRGVHYVDHPYRPAWEDTFLAHENWLNRRAVGAGAVLVPGAAGAAMGAAEDAPQGRAAHRALTAGGAGLGAYATDLLARSLLNVGNPVARAVAATGGGLLGGYLGHRSGKSLEEPPPWWRHWPFKKAAVTWKGVRRQLPNPGAKDLLLSGGMGAGVGLGVNALRDDTGLDSQERSQRRLRSALLGAGLGAGGYSLALDRGKRWLSHNFMPFDYSGRAQMTRPTLKSLWHGAIMDRPTPMRHGPVSDIHALPSPIRERALADPTYEKLLRGKDPSVLEGQLPYEQAEAYAARKELLRRYLGVHTDDPTADYFVRTATGRLNFNPAITGDPNSITHKALFHNPNAQPLAASSPNEAMQKNMEYNRYGGLRPLRNVFGGHDFPLVPGSYGRSEKVPGGYKVDRQLLDAWDFKVDPAERAEAAGYLGDMVRHPTAIPSILRHPAVYAADERQSHFSVGQRLRELLGRHMAEFVLKREAPLVNQTIRLHYGPQGGQPLVEPLPS